MRSNNWLGAFPLINKNDLEDRQLVKSPARLGRALWCEDLKLILKKRKNKKNLTILLDKLVPTKTTVFLTNQ